MLSTGRGLIPTVCVLWVFVHLKAANMLFILRPTQQYSEFKNRSLKRGTNENCLNINANKCITNCLWKKQASPEKCSWIIKVKKQVIRFKCCRSVLQQWRYLKHEDTRKGDKNGEIQRKKIDQKLLFSACNHR